jgi:hypothetical protein
LACVALSNKLAMTFRAIKEARQAFKVRKEWLGEGGHPSPAAQERANTCLACPHHTKEHPLEEAAKRLAVRLTLDLKRQNGWQVDNEDKLGLCGLCWCLLEVKVHVPLDIARENTPDWEKFPEQCWLIAEKP